MNTLDRQALAAARLSSETARLGETRAQARAKNRNAPSYRLGHSWDDDGCCVYCNLDGCDVPHGTPHAALPRGHAQPLARPHPRRGASKGTHPFEAIRLLHQRNFT